MTAEIINSAVAVVLWSVVAVRSRLFRRPGPARALGLTLLTIAAAQTTRIPFVHHGIESGLQSAIGLTGVSMVLKHSFAIVAAASMLALVETPRARPVRRRLVTAAVLVFSILACLVDPQPVPPALQAYDELYGTSPGLWLHWIAYLGFLTWYLLSMIRVCLGYRRDAEPADLRRGMTLVAVGSAFGLVYVVGKTAMLLAWSSGDGERWLSLDAAVQAVVVGCCLVLTAVGTSWSSIQQARRQAAGARRVRASLRTLHPLWSLVTTAVPSVVLDLEGPSPSRAGWRGRRRELQLRQIRQITEIQDGVRELRRGPWPAADGARDPVVEAARIEWACRNQNLPAGEAGRTEPTHAITGPADVPTETAWLESVSRALGDRERIRALTDEFDRASALGPG